MSVCQSLEDLQLGPAEMEISHVPGGKKKARKLEMECIIPYCIGTDVLKGAFLHSILGCNSRQWT